MGKGGWGIGGRAMGPMQPFNKQTGGGEDFKDCYTKDIHAQTWSFFHPSNHYSHTGANVYPLEQRCIITPLAPTLLRDCSPCFQKHSLTQTITV